MANCCVVIVMSKGYFKMKQILVNVPEPYLKDMDLLIKRGLYPNRSELIRLAIRDLLLKHGFAPWPEERKKE